MAGKGQIRHKPNPAPQRRHSDAGPLGDVVAGAALPLMTSASELSAFCVEVWSRAVSITLQWQTYVTNAVVAIASGVGRLEIVRCLLVAVG